MIITNHNRNTTYVIANRVCCGSFWITNAVAAEVSSDAISTFTTSIDRIVTNNGWKVDLETPDIIQTDANISKRTTIEWNVEWIKSQYLYSKGFKGKVRIHITSRRHARSHLDSSL